MFEFESLDAIGLADLVARKEISAGEVLEASVATIEALNPKLNAVVNKLYDRARSAIRHGLPEGPLTGVPILIKDITASMEGVPTTAGSRLLVNVPAVADSDTVRRYRNAGLVLLAKSNTPEFGLNLSTEPTLFGATRNPWDLSRSAGGSSGGSAAAVAARMVPVGHASDGGGSIRIPASCCGLFGLKPTRGRISVAPNGEGWGGLATQHAVTRSVRDSALLLDISAGPATGDPYWAAPAASTFLAATKRDPATLRIAAFDRAPNGVPVDPECVKAVQEAARLCESLGHRVEEAYPDYPFEDMRLAAATVICANIRATIDAACAARGRSAEPDELEPITWLCYEAGKTASAADYVAAMRVVHGVGRQIAPFFERFDVLLTSVLAKPPIPLGVADTRASNPEAFVEVVKTYSPYCQVFNVTGQPAMSVPLHWTASGLPVGVHFAAPYGADEVLFSLAAQLERAKPWADRRPKL
jgi:Asp-tRNA(Asn)/Glu-tRNA(Gln) amidotransferase A subunit family amidase